MAKFPLLIALISLLLLSLPLITSSSSHTPTPPDNCSFLPKDQQPHHSTQPSSSAPTSKHGTWSFHLIFWENLVSFWDLLLEQFKKSLQNDFIGGSVILTISGFFAAILYRVTNDIKQAIFNKMYFTVEIQKGTDPYYWLTNFLVSNNVVQRSSRFSVVLDSTFNPSSMGAYAPQKVVEMPKISFLPIGTKTTYKYLYDNSMIWITIEGEGQLNVNKGIFFHGKQDFTNDRGYSLQTFNFDKSGPKVIKSLLASAYKEYLHSTNEAVEIFLARHGNWERIGSKQRRPFSSIILDGNLGEKIHKDAIEFLQEENWYASRGIPYRRGYLLSGPPGVGKTSLIFSLAGELRLSVCIISLSSNEIDGYTFNRLVNTAPENGIILLEDIDAAFGMRDEVGIEDYNVKDQRNLSFQSNPNGIDFYGEKRKKSQFSLSDLLNGIDGITGQEGRLLFMTSNYPEKLDPALIRPGRVDVHEKFHLATQEQIRQLFLRFYPEENNLDDLAEKFSLKLESGKYSMAKIQGYLMNYRRNPIAAVNNVQINEI